MRIGILFNGISYDVSNKNIAHLWQRYIKRDYRKHYKNHFKYLINPFKTFQGTDNEVCVYFSTKYSKMTKKIAATYGAKKYVASKSKEDDNQTKLLKRGMKLVLREKLDLLIITRFDIDFCTDISKLDIQLDKINYVFKEFDIGDSAYWGKSQKVSDCLIMVGKKQIYPFYKAVKQESERYGYLHVINDFVKGGIDGPNVNFCIPYEMLSGINHIWDVRHPYKTKGLDRDVITFYEEQRELCKHMRSIMLSADTPKMGKIEIPDLRMASNMSYSQMCTAIQNIYIKNNPSAL